ncbi:MAG TPA: uroporphyrinogen-III synthase [Brumimicrobium sp.]|nr:uroporphyrinogen-III synthase [Brumimicrobium sp.]
MLFISKKVTDKDFLAFVEKKEIKLIDQPMISFVAEEFDCPKNEFEVVFFTSPRSAGFYLDQCTIPESVAIATIGKSTSEYVESRGYKVDFTGITSGNPVKVSAEFSIFVEGRSVLFPQSNYSHQSMQKRLYEGQITDLIVYKTALTPVKLDVKPSILVFTSPTNLNSFLQLNKVNKDQKIIAWGKTTEAFLNANDLKADFTLEYSSFEELEGILKKHFYS